MKTPLLFSIAFMTGLSLNAQSWSLTSAPQTETYTTGAASAAGTSLYVGSFNGIVRSIDNGLTWEVITVPGFVQDVDAANSDKLVCIATNAAYVSTDKGATWTNSGVNGSKAVVLDEQHVLVTDEISTQFYSNDFLTTSAASATAPRIVSGVLNGSMAILGSYGSSIYTSNDYGATFATTGYSGFGATTVTAIAKGQGNTYFSINSGGLHKSTDGGMTWAQVTTGLFGQHRDLISDANGNLYLMLSNKVYRSIDNGQSFQDVSVGLPVDGNYCNDLMITGDGSIFAVLSLFGTPAQTGIYKFTPETGVGIQEVNQAMFQVYPNPATNQVNIQLNKEAKSAQLFDATGRVARTFVIQNLTQQLDLTGIEAGMYVLSIAGHRSQMLCIH